MAERGKCSVIAANVCFECGKGTEKRSILNTVNIAVAKGNVYGILGPTECGKTTLLKVLIGLKRPTRGEVSIFGYKPGSYDFGIGYCPQEISLPTFIKVNELFKYFGRTLLIDKYRIETQMKYVLNSLNVIDENEFISNLSEDEKRRVSLAIALFTFPRLLVLDEPTIGLDPFMTQIVWSFLTSLARHKSITVIVASKSADQMKFVPTVAFMRNGLILDEKSTINYKNLEEMFVKLCVSLRSEKRLVFSNTKKKSEEADVDKHLNSTIETNDGLNKNEVLKHLQFYSILWLTLLSYSRCKFFILIYILPVIAITSCIACVGKMPRDVRIGWLVDEQRCEECPDVEEKIPFLPDLFLNCVDQNFLKIIEYVKLSEAIKDARRCKIFGYVHFKNNFSENFYKSYVYMNEDSDYIHNDTIDSGRIHLTMDASNTLLYRLVERQLFNAAIKLREEAIKEVGLGEHLSSLPLQVGDAIHESVETESYSQYTQNVIVSVLVTISLSCTICVTAASIHSNITDTLYVRLIVSGVKSLQLLVGELIARFLIMSSSSLFTLFVAVYLLNVPCRGSLLFAVLILLLQVLCAVNLGTLFAYLVKSSFLCQLITTSFSIAVVVFSGVFWSPESLPYFIKPFTWLVPGSLQVRAMLKIFNYEHISFKAYLLPACLSSLFYTTVTIIWLMYLFKNKFLK